MTLSLRIDPGPPTDGWRNLFPSDGEFVGAIGGMRKWTSVLKTVPDGVFIEFYAYEVLERAREFGPVGEDEAWQIPFWAEAVFDAADIRVHAGREIERMLPVFDRVVIAVRPVELLITEANRVLGAARFDPRRYARALADLATVRGWEVES